MISTSIYMIFYIFQKVWWINRSCPLLRHGFRFLLIFLFPYLYYNKFIKIKKTEEKAGGAVLFPTDTEAKAADLRDKSPAFLTGDGKRKVTSQGRKCPFSGMQDKKAGFPKSAPPVLRPFWNYKKIIKCKGEGAKPALSPWLLIIWRLGSLSVCQFPAWKPLNNTVLSPFRWYVPSGCKGYVLACSSPQGVFRRCGANDDIWNQSLMFVWWS